MSNHNSNGLPYKDAWDDEGKDEIEQSPQVPQQQIQNQPQIYSPLQAIQQRKQQQVNTVTEILRPKPFFNPNTLRQPFVIPALVIGGIVLMGGCMGTTAIIVSALPNSQVTRQQEVLGALAMESQRPEPRCIGWCPTFAGMDTSRLNTAGVSTDISSGVAEQPIVEEGETNSQQSVEVPEPIQKNEPQLSIYNPANTRYKQWYNWYATRTPQEVANDANTLTDVDCANDSDRCNALNDVKVHRNM